MLFKRFFSTPPNVYPKLNKNLPNLLEKPLPEKYRTALQGLAERPKASFDRRRLVERLKEDGGDKILQLNRSFLHIDYKRFIPVCSDIRGLSLNNAFKQLEWSRQRVSRRMEQVLEEFIVVAKENDFDLEKTYVADIYVEDSYPISKTFVKGYVRGRGRYGSTPHPKFAVVKAILQEREKPFAVREKDPLEVLRQDLRDQVEAKNAQDVYEQKRQRRVIKPVFF